MKTNLNTVLTGPKTVLVPYRREHVERYHQWMLSEELRTLTASEPLTLDQEYQMQRKWQEDPDKLTFIILARSTDTEDARDLGVSILGSGSDEELEKEVTLGSSLSNLRMVGDVNLFLKAHLDLLRLPRGTRPAPDAQSPDYREEDWEVEDEGAVAEVEIMIAEPEFRKRGFASEALRLMLTYATGAPPDSFSPSPSPSASPTSTPTSSTSTSSLPAFPSPLGISPSRLITRISDTNEPSIRLFEKLGFKITRHVEVFEEVEMRYRPSPQDLRRAPRTHPCSMSS